MRLHPISPQPVTSVCHLLWWHDIQTRVKHTVRSTSLSAALSLQSHSKNWLIKSAHPVGQDVRVSVLEISFAAVLCLSNALFLSADPVVKEPAFYLLTFSWLVHEILFVREPNTLNLCHHPAISGVTQMFWIPAAGAQHSEIQWGTISVTQRYEVSCTMIAFCLLVVMHWSFLTFLNATVLLIGSDLSFKGDIHNTKHPTRPLMCINCS